MSDIALPHWSDVWSFEQVLNEVAPSSQDQCLFLILPIRGRNSRREWQRIRRVEVVQRPIPLPQSRRSLYPSLNISTRRFHRPGHIHPLRQVTRNRRCQSHQHPNSLNPLKGTTHKPKNTPSRAYAYSPSKASRPVSAPPPPSHPSPKAHPPPSPSSPPPPQSSPPH